MRRKYIAWAGAVASTALAYFIPKELEIRGMITPESDWLPYAIFAIVLALIAIVVWGYWPEINQARKGIHHRRWNIGLIIGAAVIACSIPAMILIVPKLPMPIKDTRTPLQIQLDNLIADIAQYEANLPPPPIAPDLDSTNTTELEEYDKAFWAWATPIWAEYYDKFSDRIANIMIQLHNIHVVTDDEFLEDRVDWEWQYAHTIVSIFRGHLQDYKIRLDELVEQMQLNNEETG
jgi:hypothetical protein